MVIVQVLQIIALVCFFAAAIEWPPNVHQRLIAAGLFLWLLSALIGSGR